MTSNRETGTGSVGVDLDRTADWKGEDGPLAVLDGGAQAGHVALIYGSDGYSSGALDTLVQFEVGTHLRI